MTTVSELMTTDVVTVSPQCSVPELERALASADVSGMPVVEDGRLVGVVSARDVLRRLGAAHSEAELVPDYYTDLSGFAHAALGEAARAAIGAAVGDRVDHLCVADLMSPAVIAIGPDTDISVAARLMVERRVHRLPVVAGDRLAGLVTALDLLRWLAGLD
ncbi:MAG: CBS domain-containing protein [Gammaproteobacteria bacterium]